MHKITSSLVWLGWSVQVSHHFIFAVEDRGVAASDAGRVQQGQVGRGIKVGHERLILQWGIWLN